MSRRNRKKQKFAARMAQMAIAFPRKAPLAANDRSEVIALLSRLLLQVAKALEGREVRDDAS